VRGTVVVGMPWWTVTSSAGRLAQCVWMPGWAFLPRGVVTSIRVPARMAHSAAAAR
jgi:hypothetical protein